MKNRAQEMELGAWYLREERVTSFGAVNVMLDAKTCAWHRQCWELRKQMWKNSPILLALMANYKDRV